MSRKKIAPTDAAPISARDRFLAKPFGGLHPEVVANYTPVRAVKIPRKNTADEYGGLTDSSTYSEYAWAFLRRNRFYQRFIDEDEKHIFTFSDWGYLSYPEAKPSFGLDVIKPYYDPFNWTPKVRWNGIHTFADRLSDVYPRHQGLLDIDQPGTQVAVVFDIDALLGTNTTALEHQIKMAEKRLWALSEAAGIRRKALGKDPDKHLLRAQLRVADLISNPAEIRSAQSSKQDLSIFQDEAGRLSISEIAMNFLPEFDIKESKQKAHPKSINDQMLASVNLNAAQAALANKTSRIKRVSTLLSAAWNNIYNWQCLNLLQYDDWSDLASSRVRKLVLRSF